MRLVVKRRSGGASRIQPHDYAHFRPVRGCFRYSTRVLPRRCFAPSWWSVAAAQFAVKLLQYEDLAPEALRSEVDAFLERARAQKQAGANPDDHWATLHHFAKTPGGAFYVTDLCAASVQTLIDRSVVPSARELTRLVAAIVRGLRTMRAVVNRAHGNLKPSNVLLSTSSLGDADIKLTDPATDQVAAQVGESGDLHALGVLDLPTDRTSPAG